LDLAGAHGLSGSRQQAAAAGHVREPYAVTMWAACGQPEAAARAATMHARARCQGLWAQWAHCCRVAGSGAHAAGPPRWPHLIIRAHQVERTGASPTHRHNLGRRCRTVVGRWWQAVAHWPAPSLLHGAMRANAARPVKSRPNALPVPLHSTITGSPSCLACTQPGPAVHGEPATRSAVQPTC
jgi:hypothetical protein